MLCFRSGGAIAGIVIGSLLGAGILAAVVVVIIFLFRKRQGVVRRPMPPGSATSGATMGMLLRYHILSLL